MQTPRQTPNSLVLRENPKKRNHIVDILTTCREIHLRNTIPEPDHFSNLVAHMVDVLQFEESTTRPRDSSGRPGGLINLRSDLPTLLVPDLHARRGLIVAILQHEIDGISVAALLQKKELQMVCLGDGLHSENDTTARWRQAYGEFAGNFSEHDIMDEEMCEGLGLMEMIFQLKIAFPQHFHFLKGNHENILNEEADGNIPFMKKALEGAMVRSYFSVFYGDRLLHIYAGMEKNLPLLARGGSFLVSHAEPKRVYSSGDVIEYRSHPDVIFGLTWTPDDVADEKNVEVMLESYLPGKGRWYFAGHRNISGRYRQKYNGRFIQIHNRTRYQVAYVPCDRLFEPSQDIICLPQPV